LVEVDEEEMRIEEVEVEVEEALSGGVQRKSLLLLLVVVAVVVVQILEMVLVFVVEAVEPLEELEQEEETEMHVQMAQVDVVVLLLLEELVQALQMELLLQEAMDKMLEIKHMVVQVAVVDILEAKVAQVGAIIVEEEVVEGHL
jgi:hypothetical protein